MGYLGQLRVQTRLPIWIMQRGRCNIICKPFHSAQRSSWWNHVVHTWPWKDHVRNWQTSTIPLLVMKETLKIMLLIGKYSYWSVLFLRYASCMTKCCLNRLCGNLLMQFCKASLVSAMGISCYILFHRSVFWSLSEMIISLLPFVWNNFCEGQLFILCPVKEQNAQVGQHFSNCKTLFHFRLTTLGLDILPWVALLIASSLALLSLVHDCFEQMPLHGILTLSPCICLGWESHMFQGKSRLVLLNAFCAQICNLFNISWYWI